MTQPGVTPLLHAVALEERSHMLLRPQGQGAAAERDAALRRQQAAAAADQAEQLRREAYAAGLAAGKLQAAEQARLAGVAQGEASGRAAALAEYQARIGRLDAMLTGLTEAIAGRLDAAEEDMVALAFAAACSVLGDAAVSAAGARGALRGALAQLRTRPLVALRVHPQDLLLLRSDSAIAELIVRHGAAGALQWRADEQVVLGGCVLETAEGTLDARIETQLQALCASLLATRADVAAQAAQAALPEGGVP